VKAIRVVHQHYVNQHSRNQNYRKDKENRKLRLVRN